MIFYRIPLGDMKVFFFSEYIQLQAEY
jgi:hypothetical protein